MITDSPNVTSSGANMLPPTTRFSSNRCNSHPRMNMAGTTTISEVSGCIPASCIVRLVR